MKDLSFITIEEHFTAKEIMDANNSFAPKREMTEEQKKIWISIHLYHTTTKN